MKKKIKKKKIRQLTEERTCPQIAAFCSSANGGSASAAGAGGRQR